MSDHYHHSPFPLPKWKFKADHIPAYNVPSGTWEIQWIYVWITPENSKEWHMAEAVWCQQSRGKYYICTSFYIYKKFMYMTKWRQSTCLRVCRLPARTFMKRINWRDYGTPIKSILRTLSLDLRKAHSKGVTEDSQLESVSSVSKKCRWEIP